MAITNKLITFNKLTSFETQLAQGNILETSIVFIKDAKKIWTKGTYFDCSGGGSNSIGFIEIPTGNYVTDDIQAEGLVVHIITLLDEQKAVCSDDNVITLVVLLKSEGGDKIYVLNRTSPTINGVCDFVGAGYQEGYIFKFRNTTSAQMAIRKLALKSDIPNTDEFLQYLDPNLKTIAVNGLLGDDEMIYALPNSSIIESEDYDKILATRDDIGYTTEFSVADIEAIYGRGITKPINVQGLISAIEANKPIIIPTNITDASNVGGNAVTMAKMENDGFIYLNVIVPYLDGVHKEYFIQIKITTAQLIKSGSNGSITLKELVAKTDLKTINGESILGSGDIAVQGGGDNRYFTEFTVEDVINACENGGEISYTSDYIDACLNNKILCVPFANQENGYLIANNVGNGYLDLYIGPMLYSLYPGEDYEYILYGDFPLYKSAQPVRVDGNIEPMDGNTYIVETDYEMYRIAILAYDLNIGASVRFYAQEILDSNTGEKHTTQIEILGYGEVLWANGVIPEIEPNTWYELSLTTTAEGDTLAVLTPFKSV